MEITITISKARVNRVRALAQEFTGRAPTEQQLKKFFEGDVKFLYSEFFDDCLEDSVEGFFG